MAIRDPKLLDAAAVTGPWTPWNGGKGVFAAQGTWAGASATLQFTLNEHADVLAGTATAFTVSAANLVFSSDNFNGFQLPRCFVRALVSNAGGGTSLSATVASIE